MGNPAAGWTLERRKRQREAIKRWQPWAKSTGPKSAEGKAVISRNADKGGQWRAERGTLKALRQVLRDYREVLRRVGG